MIARTVIAGAHVVTVDAAGTEFPDGHLVIDGAEIVAVGSGAPPAWALDGLAADGSAFGEVVEVTVVDGRGRLLTPGLINTHHHLYQWLTRGYAQDSILFDWLSTLYPIWARIDADLTHVASLGAMGVLARSGCTLVGDHHYVFPKGSGDIVGGIVAAGAEIGVRVHATRGSMDLGASDGGLPPDFAVETTAAALNAGAEAVAAYHDPSREAMAQVALAPCSPFSVTADLLRESAVLARELNVRLHTHGSETVEEDAYTRERFGMSPTQYLESVGWLGPDVWMAHCVHLDEDAIARFAATGTGVAHCPVSNARLGSGIAPVPQLLDAGVPVGLGVDGAASNESGKLGEEIHAAVLMNRLRAGADRMPGRKALWMATMGGARVLGRSAELGSLEVGKLADVALWVVDGIDHAGLIDPVAALTLAAQPPLALLLVHGRPVVVDDTLVTADEALIAERVAGASKELAGRV